MSWLKKTQQNEKTKKKNPQNPKKPKQNKKLNAVFNYCLQSSQTSKGYTWSTDLLKLAKITDLLKFNTIV